MLARLLRIATLLQAALALLWLSLGLIYWQIIGFASVAAVLFAIIFFHGLFIATHFLRMQRANRTDPVPPAGWTAVAAAWLSETLTAWRVFYWRQPWRSHLEADHVPVHTPANLAKRHAGPPAGDAAAPVARSARGVVFIHGFVCNRGLWLDWMHRLRGEGAPFVAVNLEPVFGSIDGYAPQVEAAVRQLEHATGLPPLLVCHSMGGLAARAWLRSVRVRGGDPLARVHRIVTIGSPHHGTRLGDGLPHVPAVRNGEQMRHRSAWLQDLAAQEPGLQMARFVCFYSNCDNIVFPTSTATLAGADNRLVPGCAHVALAFHPRVMDESLALL